MRYYPSIAKQKEVVKQAVATEKSARAQLKEIQQKMKDSKSHHEKELKEAEAAIVRAKKEAESVVKEAKSRVQEMQALTLEVEELEKGLVAQQEQVSSQCVLYTTIQVYVCYLRDIMLAAKPGWQ